MLGGLAAAGHAAQLSPAYYGGLTAVAAHLAWQLRTVDLKSPASCSAKFRSNAGLGGVVFADILAGQLT